MSSSCKSGGFFKSPAANSEISLTASSNDNAQITLEWNPDCIPKIPKEHNDLADVYLYDLNAADAPRVHYWVNVPFSQAKANFTLNPAWWNNNASVSLSFTLVASGDLPFLSPVPPGPRFTVKYDKDHPPSFIASNPTYGADGHTDQSGKEEQKAVAERELSKGKIAVGVLIPLLIIALAIFGYIKYQRRKARKAREEWTEKIDKRMSVVSQDWKSMSIGGAQAAVRASMAGEGAFRRSQFGEIRPVSSVYAPEMNSAGFGSGGFGGYQVEVGPDGMPSPMSMPTPSPTSSDPLNPRTVGVGLRSSAHSNAQIAQRVSRVSFADSANTRPSGETRRSIYSTYERKSRAFHQGHVPPVPSGRLNASSPTFDEETGMMSPRQTAGARSLTPDDIHARAASVYAVEGEDVGPALNMMRAQSEEEAQYAAMPSFPVPMHHEPTSFAFAASADPTLFSASPVTATFPSAGSPFAASLSPRDRSQTLPPAEPAAPPMAMSPDEMLRAYAERAKSPPLGARATPSPGLAARERSRTLDMGGLGGPMTVNTSVAPVPAANGVMSPTRGAYGVE